MHDAFHSGRLSIGAAVAAFLLFAALVATAIFFSRQDDEEAALSETTLIRVESPRPNETVSSPLVIKGMARGNWFFEASFPIRLLDANGNEIPLDPPYLMTAEDWMTSEFVPFEATIAFAAPATETGTLVLQKNNPSGLPEYDDELRIPVRFTPQPAETPLRTVKLYYYDPDRDLDAEGNIMCSRQGLVAVERQIPLTMSPIRDTINLLLKGELTAAERAQGITTEYPLEGVTLKNAVLQNGVLTLTFDDPENRTGGGSCRVGILWFQIEATAKQFENVTSARFLPEELFQP